MRTEVLRLRLDVAADLGVGVHALPRIAESDRRADEGGGALGGQARPEYVVREAGEQAFVRAAVGGDADGDAEVGECAVDLEHPRGLGQVGAVRQ